MPTAAGSLRLFASSTIRPLVCSLRGRLLTAVAGGLVLLALAPSAAVAATMEVQIHIKGRGTVTGADGFSCTNDDPNPAIVYACTPKNYTAPDPIWVPEITFTATTDQPGWGFAQWSDANFASCNAIVDNTCTIKGRQNAFVVRPATVDFTRSGAPPSTISSATTTDRSATFAYAESEGVSAIACTLETLSGAVVASGCDNAGARHSFYDGIASGLYRFRFRVTDFFGHVGDTTADVAVLQTTIGSGPPPIDSNTSPHFTFAAPGAAGFRCSISGGIQGTQDCGSPFTTPVIRPDGRYTMTVFAVNGSFSDPSPATWTWIVDMTPPSATIKEPAEGALLSTPVATLVFDGADSISSAADLRYECRLDDDRAVLAACPNPYTTPALRTGPHSLDVRAVDQAGNRSATVRRTWRVDFPDADGDGYHSDVDCDDSRASVHPGAVDLPRNGIDEDCRGGDADYPRIDSPVLNKWATLPRGLTKVLRLSVTQIPPGAAAEVRCSGRGCPFRSHRPKIRAGTASGARAFGRRSLAKGTVVEVRVTAPGMIGKVVRFTMRSGGKLPKSTVLCLMPGASKPASC